MDKIVVYTALFTDDINYIHGELPEYENVNIDFICFTNTPYLKSNTWEIRVIGCELGGRKTARKYKILSHNYIPGYDGWIWMDNSCIFNYNPTDLYEHYMDGYDICLHEHCDRTDIKQEAQVLISRGLDDVEIISNQVGGYYKNGYQDQGLYETGILMRRNIPEVVQFNEAWWAEINTKSVRDQLSFPYTKWRNPNVKINSIKETFVAHTTLLGKQQSKHFSTLPREKIKLR